MTNVSRDTIKNLVENLGGKISDVFLQIYLRAREIKEKTKYGTTSN